MENERKAERDEKIERKMERIIIDLANIFFLGIMRIHILFEVLTQFHHKCYCIFFSLIIQQVITIHMNSAIHFSNWLLYVVDMGVRVFLSVCAASFHL